jgi:fumarate reductase subunit C
MSVGRRIPLEGFVGLYFLFYLPNIIVTKLVTSLPNPVLGRPLTGLETLPASLILNTLMTYAFIWWSGWHRDAHGVNVASVRIPVPTRYTLLSGIGTALIVFTVPLSFTFKGVSIPYIQLLMRGDILIIAPLVDLMFGRRVRWWSWVALVLVAFALFITLRARGGLDLPPLAILTIVLYTAGYFFRLTIMTRIAKNGDPASLRRYFVEEKIFALPASVACLAILSALGLGSQADELSFGFIGVWGNPVIVWLAVIAVTLTIVSIFSIIILLDPRENAYCVPMERAASLVAGVGASLILAWLWGLRAPSSEELLGGGILIAAIVLLSLAPRFQSRFTGAPVKAQ